MNISEIDFDDLHRQLYSLMDYEVFYDFSGDVFSGIQSLTHTSIAQAEEIVNIMCELGMLESRSEPCLLYPLVYRVKKPQG
jgi:hypothetical protein